MVSVHFMSPGERYMMGMPIAHDLSYGDRFWCQGKLWQHRGWYSAVEHVAAYCLSNCPENERNQVIAHVEPVTQFIETFHMGLGI